MVKAQVLEMLGSESAVDLEVAKGSPVVYVTFKHESKGVGQLVDSLRRSRAQITLTQSLEGQLDIMTPIGKGMTILYVLHASFQCSRHLSSSDCQNELLEADLRAGHFAVFGQCLTGSLWDWMLVSKPILLHYVGLVNVATSKGRLPAHGAEACTDT